MAPALMAGFDLAVVGAGICGLAHALAAARRGRRVVVIDRDAECVGASVRNFGFVTVTGQAAGDTWRRAMRSREVWAELAPLAGIPIRHHGLALAARRPESRAVLEAFLATGMGRGCELLEPRAARARFPFLATAGLEGVLVSPHELRVESRAAVPALARYLEHGLGVGFMRETVVHGVEPPLIATSRGPVAAEACVVCPGDDFKSLLAPHLAAHGLTRCKLHMLRLADPGQRLGTAVMSDLGLVRYLGYAALPQAAALRRRLAAEQPRQLEHGVHLIVVQDGDGSLIVGDSHHYAATPDPFQPAAVDELILEELRAVLALPPPAVVERWVGTYASAADRQMVVDRPAERVRVVVITSGTGASTSFAIGEEVVAELFG